MPVVPVYGPRRVETAPLPTVQQNPNAPAAAFQKPEPVSLSGVQQVAGQMALEAKRKADQVAVLDADNQLASLSTSLETEALQRKGKDALGATQDVQAQWNEQAAKIEGGLTSDDQKLAFQQHQSARWNALHQTVELHAAREAEQYDTDQTKSALENTYQAALKDPTQVGDAVTRTTAIWKDYAARQGMSPEATTEGLQTAVSHLHAGVFERILETPATDGGGDLAAKQYLAANRDAMTGTDQNKADQLMHAGSVRGASQRASDSIVATKATEGDALREAANIQDPDVRAATEDRIRQHFMDVRRETVDAQNAAFQQAGDLIEKGTSYEALPLSLRLAMSPGDRQSLQVKSRQMRNPERVSNPELLNSIMNAAGLNEATRRAFANTDLSKYRDSLSEEDYRWALAKQLQVREQYLSGDRTEERRDEHAAEAEAKKQAKTDAAIEAQLEMVKPDSRDMVARQLAPQMSPALRQKYHLDTPVPGAPILPPPAMHTPSGAPVTGTPGGIDLRPSGRPTASVPASWLEHAKTNPRYLSYLAHMGVEVA